LNVTPSSIVDRSIAASVFRQAAAAQWPANPAAVTKFYILNGRAPKAVDDTRTTTPTNGVDASR
jgi:hypothetical protein